MRIFSFLTTILLALQAVSGAALAQESGQTTIGGDLFAAGTTAVNREDGHDDLFLAGESVRQEAPILGNGHLVGRRVSVSRDIGGDLYAAGMDVDVAAPVAGDVTAAGYNVRVAGAVGGDVRAAGQRIDLLAPVAGYALMAGERLMLDAVVGGDAVLAGQDIEFGEAARVEGRLSLYADDPDAIDVPERVAPESRIDRHRAEDFEEHHPMPVPVPGGRGTVIVGFLGGVVLLTLVTILVATLAPGGLTRVRDEAFDRPLRTMWIGFLGHSALVGAAFLLVLTLVGMLVSPALLLMGVLLGVAGYIVGAYALGAALLIGFGRIEIDTLGERAVAALIGALVAGLAVLVPFLGWFFMLGLVLWGSGGLLEAMFRPVFYAAPEY